MGRELGQCIDDLVRILIVYLHTQERAQLPQLVIFVVGVWAIFILLFSKFKGFNFWVTVEAAVGGILCRLESFS